MPSASIISKKRQTSLTPKQSRWINSTTGWEGKKKSDSALGAKLPPFKRLYSSQSAELLRQFMFQTMFAEWIKFSESDVWNLNHLVSKLIMKFYRHWDRWLFLPHPISSSVPSGCLYSVNQQAVNIVFQQQSTSRGLPLNNKVSSLIPPLLTFQHSHPQT